jgi:ABC-type antimicrobial peptide transport system permease subunit
LRRLQRDLLQREGMPPRRVNALLLAKALFPKDKVTLEDLGINVRTLEDRNTLSIESESAVISDTLAEKITSVAGKTQPILSYLANSIRIGEKQVPYSLVTATGSDLPDDSIRLTEWAAQDLGAKVGDAVELEYFYWEPSGSLVTRKAQFKLAAVLPMTGIAVDRDFTPEYPGITQADSIAGWDPPFPVDLKRVRPRDEEYWKKYRTAPKAFLSLAAGQRLWGSRFGKLTSIRVEGTSDAAVFSKKLRDAIDPEQAGMTVATPRAQGLDAARGSTDFGQYFTYFSFFLVVSALLLAGLFFQLGIEQRLREIGALRAVGFAAKKVRRMFVAEGAVLSLIGAIVGTVGAVLYAAFLLYGLRTWWRGAVGTDLLALHISAASLAGGAIGGMIVAWLCVLLTLRSLRKSTPRDLLSGQRGISAEPHRETRLLSSIAWVGIVGGIAMLIASFAHAIAESEGFFGAGSLLLIGGICSAWVRLRRPTRDVDTVTGLGVRNAGYRPGRSVLSIALISSAVFLVIALDAFRRPTVSATDPKSGAGGFPLMAESQLPLLWDPNTASGRENLNIAAVSGVKFYPFRLRPGEDSSCLNLYEPRSPRILGARRDFITLARFAFTTTLAKSEDAKQNPWLLLQGATEGGAIPAIADANSITYVLHRKVGDTFTIDAGTGREVKLKLVGALDDSILQSEIVISEENFVRAFPAEQGFRFFLLDAPTSATAPLEQALSDYGFDAVSTPEKLEAFHRVENTYLSTFQALGGLGLLLGTLGLGAVLARNVIERRKELALLRAVGYRPEHLRRIVIAENLYVVLEGTVIGLIAALVATLQPLLGRGHAPGFSFAVLLLAVPLAGLVASLGAVRSVVRAPLLETLRSE